MSTNIEVVAKLDREAPQLTLSQFVENAFYIDGRPFTFTGRPYLRRVYDQIQPHTFLKCGRAVEKSTFLCSRLVALACKYPHFRNLYISASRQQALDFSRDQLDQRLQSPWIQERFFDPRSCTNAVELKTFTNSSRVRLRNVYNSPDRVRGLRADQLLADEVQDIPSRFMPIVEETLVQSPYHLEVYSGTPKTLDNPAEYYWRQTTQEEWEVLCLACHRWQEGGLTRRNVGLKGPICKYCGKWLDVSNGAWIAYGEGNGGRRLGYRIPQLIIPYYQDPKNWEEQIVDKIDRYEYGQFENEVLGFSYDEADKPITEGDIKRLCRGQWVERYANVMVRSPVFMGVDWGSGGRSKTVFVIGAFLGGRVFQVLHAHIFKPSEHPDQDAILDEICRAALHWNVSAVGVDFGYGVMENLRLRPRLGDDVVWQFQNVNQQRADIMWNEKAGRFQHAVTQTLSQLFMGVKDGKFIFPYWAKWKPFADHMLAARKEYNWSTGYVSFVKSQENPDDILHALNYAWMAGRIMTTDWLQREVSDARGRLQQVTWPSFLRRR